MKKENEIVEELKGLGSILAGMPRTMPYAVPEGYFAGFAVVVKDTINELNKEDQVPAWGKKMPYAVPADYFNTLAGDIVAKSIAASLPKDNPLSVPAGYFDSLPAQMLQAAKTAGASDVKPKTIPLAPNPIFRQLRWAAAAVVIIGMGIGAYFTFFNETPQPESENLLAMVSNNDIKDYVQGMYRVDVDQIVSNDDINKMQLDNTDIIQYLNETGWD